MRFLGASVPDIIKTNGVGVGSSIFEMAKAIYVGTTHAAIYSHCTTHPPDERVVFPSPARPAPDPAMAVYFRKNDHAIRK